LNAASRKRGKHLVLCLIDSFSHDHR